MNFGKELSIVKISREEALAFDGRFKTADEMFAHYGYDRRLQSGEHYEGYVAIWYASYMQTAAWMYGSLRKATSRDVACCIQSYILDAQKKGAYWVLESEHAADGTPVVGAVRNFDNFQQCRYAKLIVELQKEGKEWAKGITNPEALDRSIKKKILDGAIARAPFEVTEEEYLLLQYYHGKETLKGFFSVMAA